MVDVLTAAQAMALQVEFLVGAWCLFALAWLVIWILVAVWVYRDAESRGASGILCLIVRPSGPQPYQAYPGYAPPYQAAPGYGQTPYGAPPQAGQPPMQAPPVAGGQNCPRCGQPLQYVQQYQRWYCPNERVY